VDEVAEVVPVGTTCAEAWWGVLVKSLGCECYQYRGMVRGVIEAGLRYGEVRRYTFSDTEVYDIGYFMDVRRPVSGLSWGEMGEVVTFHCFKEFTTSRCDEAGTPVGMFRIVIATRNKPGSESSIVFFKLLFADCVFGREVNCRNCKVADGVSYRYTCCL
jgi:hypothetical protein